MIYRKKPRLHVSKTTGEAVREGVLKTHFHTDERAVPLAVTLVRPEVTEDRRLSEGQDQGDGARSDDVKAFSLHDVL